MSRRILFASLLSLFLLAGLAQAQCPLSGDIDNFVVIQQGDLEVQFGTTGTVFALDETVRFELVVTNTGSDPAQIDYPVHYPETVFVTDVDCPDVVSCMDAFAFTYPPVFLYVPGTINLEPGECRTWTMEWDLSEDPAPTGLYKAWGGLFAWTDGQFNLPLGVWLVPDEGASVLIELVDPVPADQVTWGEAKSVYR